MRRYSLGGTQQQQQQQPQYNLGGGGQWAGEFASQEAGNGGWAAEFTEQQPGGQWAGEFQQQQQAQAAAAQQQQQQLTGVQAETAQQSAALVQTLTANPDPKFQNSQFLQFMSRMSRGEIVVEGNGVKEVTPQQQPGAEHVAKGGQWAGEFAAQQANNGGWAGAYNRPLFSST